MSYTNRDIVPAAIRGLDRENGRGSFWTRTERGRYFRGFGWHESYGSWYGNVNAPQREFDKLSEAGYRVTQSIYSYATPIAVEVFSPNTYEYVWLIWDRTYSSTTSTRHMSQLWQLRNGGSRVEWMPYDATAEDIVGIVEGCTRYVRGKGYGKPGRFLAVRQS